MAPPAARTKSSWGEYLVGACLHMRGFFYNMSGKLLHSKSVATLRGSRLQVRQESIPDRVRQQTLHSNLASFHVPPHFHISRRGKTVGFCCGALARRLLTVLPAASATPLARPRAGVWSIAIFHFVLNFLLRRFQSRSYQCMETLAPSSSRAAQVA